MQHLVTRVCMSSWVLCNVPILTDQCCAIRSCDSADGGGVLQHGERVDEPGCRHAAPAVLTMLTLMMAARCSHASSASTPTVSRHTPLSIPNPNTGNHAIPRQLDPELWTSVWESPCLLEFAGFATISDSWLCKHETLTLEPAGLSPRRALCLPRHAAPDPEGAVSAASADRREGALTLQPGPVARVPSTQTLTRLRSWVQRGLRAGTAEVARADVAQKPLLQGRVSRQSPGKHPPATEPWHRNPTPDAVATQVDLDNALRWVTVRWMDMVHDKTDERLRSLFVSADSDGDGNLDFDEYFGMLRKLRADQRELPPLPQLIRMYGKMMLGVRVDASIFVRIAREEELCPFTAGPLADNIGVDKTAFVSLID
eukprot:820389-Rhodomonas_salina.1